MKQEEFDELRERIDQLIDEGEAATIKAERVLSYVPDNDTIVGELRALFMTAADEYEAAFGDVGNGLDEVLVAASKLHNAALTWARYVEAAADLKTIPPIEVACRKLQALGLIVDSGMRRKDRAGIDCIVWVAAPELPATVDTGDAVLNSVLEKIREVS